MKNNQTVFPVEIDGEKFEFPQKNITAKQIIELAKEKGLSGTKPPIEDLILKSENKFYSGNEEVDLSKENNFSLGPKIYMFKVNGQQMESKVNKLTAEEIIKLAKEKGITLPGSESKNLLLEAVGKQKYQFKPDEKVDFIQFNEFLLILNEPTPVA